MADFDPTTARPVGDSGAFDPATAQPVKPRGPISEIANQLKAGAIVDLPRMAGNVLKYASDPGEPIYRAGQSITEAADERGQRPDLQPEPDRHNIVTNALAEGARMIPSSVVPGLLAAPLGPVPAAIAGGAAFGASQGQETLEKAEKAGVSREAALQAARMTGLIEAGGETAGTYFGAKLFGAAGRPFSEMSRRLLGKGATDAELALESATSRAAVKPWLRQLPETAAVEVGTEIGQNAGEAYVEQQAGIPGPTPLEAGQAAIAPTLGMTALLAPFGLAGHVVRGSQLGARADTLASGQADPMERVAAARGVIEAIREADPQAAANFAQHASEAIAAGRDLELGTHLLQAPQESPTAAPGEPAGPGQPPAGPAPSITETPPDDLLQGSADNAQLLSAARIAPPRTPTLADAASLVATAPAPAAATPFSDASRRQQLGLPEGAPLPSKTLGLSPALGPLTGAAADAVDTGLAATVKANRETQAQTDESGAAKGKAGDQNAQGASPAPSPAGRAASTQPTAIPGGAGGLEAAGLIQPGQSLSNKEQGNASDQANQQGGPQGEHRPGDRSGQEAGAGGSNSLLGTAPSQEPAAPGTPGGQEAVSVSPAPIQAATPEALAIAHTDLADLQEQRKKARGKARGELDGRIERLQQAIYDATPPPPVVHYGQDGTPVHRGGTPFKTKPGASRFKAQYMPQARVMKAPGGNGFVLRDPTDRELAAGQANGARVQRDLRAASWEKNPLLAFLGKHGLYHEEGKKNSLMADFSPDRNVEVKGFGNIFRPTGLQLDMLAERAAQEGFLPRDVLDSGADRTRELHDLISRAISGKRIIPQYAEGAVEDEFAKQRARHGEEELDPQVQAELDAEHEALLEAEAQRAADDIPPEDLDRLEAALDAAWEGRENATTESAMRALGFDEKEIADAIAKQQQAPASQDRQGGGARDESPAASAPGDRAPSQEHPAAADTAEDVTDTTTAAGGESPEGGNSGDKPAAGNRETPPEDIDARLAQQRQELEQRDAEVKEWIKTHPLKMVSTDAGAGTLSDEEMQRVSDWINANPQKWFVVDDRLRLKLRDQSTNDGNWFHSGAEFLMNADGTLRMLGDAEHNWGSTMSPASVRRSLSEALGKAKTVPAQRRDAKASKGKSEHPIVAAADAIGAEFGMEPEAAPSERMGSKKAGKGYGAWKIERKGERISLSAGSPGNPTEKINLIRNTKTGKNAGMENVNLDPDAARAKLREWLEAKPKTVPAQRREEKQAAEAETATTGASDEELAQIVEAFSAAQRKATQTEEPVTHVFDPPAKGEVVRLADKARVYHEDHGWMTVAQAKKVIAEWKAHANEQDKSANANRVVLSLFDLTGQWSKPWKEAGYQVFRFDIQDDPDIGDVTKMDTEYFNDNFGDFEGNDIYAVLAAVPCTDFAVSGARHFAMKDKDGRTVESVKLVHHTLAVIEYFKPAVWAIENPVGRIEKLGGLPPWRLSFDPNQLGDPYTKKTLLWGRFNANLPVAPVEPTEGSKMHAKYGGKSQKTKNARSETPEGFSYGFFMANNAIDHPILAVANKYDRLDRALMQQALDAGLTEREIGDAVDDPYYMELDDAAAEQALREAIAERNASKTGPGDQNQDLLGAAPNEAQQAAARVKAEREAQERQRAAAAPSAAGFELGMVDQKTGKEISPGQGELLGEPKATYRVSDVTKTKAFKDWFGKSVATETGKPGGKPLVLYHGTTGDFSTFDRTRGNVESDFGAGFYFSNNSEDVAANYAGEGPDLTQKIELLSERLETNVRDDLLADRVREKLGLTEDADLDPYTSANWNSEKHNQLRKALKDIARQELGVEHGGASMPVFLSIQNPAIVGGKNETILTMEEKLEPLSSFQKSDINDLRERGYGDEDIRRELANRNGYLNEPTGTLIDFLDALRQVASRYHDGSVDEAITSIMEEADFQGIKLGEALQLLKADAEFGQYVDYEAHDAPLVSHEIVREALERAGFDGIIDHTVDVKFGSQRRIGQGMKGMNADTVHYIVFEPEQIKSAIGNRGTFSKTDANITREPEKAYGSESSNEAAALIGAYREKYRNGDPPGMTHAQWLEFVTGRRDASEKLARQVLELAKNSPEGLLLPLHGNPKTLIALHQDPRTAGAWRTTTFIAATMEPTGHMEYRTPIEAAGDFATRAEGRAQPAQQEQNRPYETDLFGNPLPHALPRTGRAGPARAQPRGEQLSGNVQPAPAVQDTPAPPGDYYVNTIVGHAGQRRIGAAQITNAAEAAQATGYLYKSAVERFDAVVTDKFGKPLAIVGSFKGAPTQTSVYPAVVLGEALRVPGATDIWLSHNHPSGNSVLSTADLMLTNTFARGFEGTGITVRGLLAVSNGKYSFKTATGEDQTVQEEPIPPAKGFRQIPIIERELQDDRVAPIALTSPSAAKAVAKQFYDRTNGPGLLLLDAQYQVAGWVPLQDYTGQLANTGKLRALHRALSQANTNAIIVVHGGEADQQTGGGMSVVKNIANALTFADVRVLDATNVVTGESMAERGTLPAGGGAVFSLSTAPGPVWRSELADRIGKAAYKQAPAESWLSFINGLAKNGVKPDEIEWSGVREWLAMQQGKVPKEALLEFLNQNGVQVQEVVKGSETATSALDDARVKLDALGYDMQDGEYGPVIVRRSDGKEFIYFENEEAFYESGTEDTRDEDADALPESAQRWAGVAQRVFDNDADEDYRGEGDTRYGQYTLPGGSNYREVLLTLPERFTYPETPVLTRAQQDRLAELGQKMSRNGSLPPAEMSIWRGLKDQQQAHKDELRALRDAGKNGEPYRSSHWGEPNVLAHIRLNDRTDAAGKRVLFVEEIQSDWGQAGKKQGFKSDPQYRYEVFDSKTGTVTGGYDNEDAAIRATQVRGEDGLYHLDYRRTDSQAEPGNKVPRAPFVGKTDAWVTLALKRIVKMAVDEGYDKVAFVTGEQSAERYDLSKQISRVRFEDNHTSGIGKADLEGEHTFGRLLAYDLDGKQVIDRTMQDAPKELPDMIGKEAASKLLNQPGRSERTGGGNESRVKELSGLDLKVGGEGMRAFYDKIVPAAANKLLAKMGGNKIEEVRIPKTEAKVKDIDYKALRADLMEIARTDMGQSEFFDEWEDLRGIITEADLEDIGNRDPHNQYRNGPAVTALVAKVRQSAAAGKAMKQTGFEITPAMREAASQGVPMFKRGTAAGGMDHAAILQAVSRITRDWLRKPAIHVIDDMSEAPADVFAQWQRQQSRAATGEPEGFHSRGEVYLLAGHMADPATVARVLYHEALGHFGLRGHFGPLLDAVLAQVSRFRPEEVASKARAYGLDPANPQDRLIAAEEVLAEMAQARPEIGWVQKAIAAIRSFLREHVPGFERLALSDDEIIRDYLLPARGWVERGKQGAPDFGRSMQASQGLRTIQVDGKRYPIENSAGQPIVANHDVQKLRAFWRFMGGSKVVDEQGRPLVVYHGTNNDFSEFDRLWSAKNLGRSGSADQIGSWFSTIPGEGGAAMYGKTIMPVYLAITKPYTTTFERMTRNARQLAGLPAEGGRITAEAVDALRTWMKEAGYDGIHIQNDQRSGSREFEQQDAWLALEPNQIKSAIGNNGDFDPNDPNISFSRFDPSRRQFVMGTAAALAVGGARAETTLGRAKAIPAAIMGAQVSPEVAKILRGNGATNPDGATALRKALQLIASSGPIQVRALASQIIKLLPESDVMLTVDDKRLMNAHGAVTLIPIPHLQLFTAGGRTGLTYDTLLHESLHVAVAARYRSLSVGMVRSNDALLKVAPPGAAQAMAQFRAVWGEFKTVALEALGSAPAKSDLRLSLEESISNPDEFFVRALTDPTLQTFMAGKRYEGKTLLERFKDWVKTTLLGFKESGTAPSWLDAALAATGDLNTAMLVDKADFSRLGAINRMDAQRSATNGDVHANQIKSASGNRGTFDANESDIRFSMVGNVRHRQHTQDQIDAMKRTGQYIEPVPLKERLKALHTDAGKKLAQGLVDQFRPIRDIDQDAYALLRLSKGASGAFEVLLNGGRLKLTDNVYDFDDTRRGGVVERLLKPLQGEHHDFMRWVAAFRAERLSREDREHLFSPQDIAAFKSLADGQLEFDFKLLHGPRAGQITRNRLEAYKDSNITFNEFHKNTLDMAEQSGLIDGASRPFWEGEFYVPFYRVMEDGIRGMNIKSGPVRQQAFKHLKGGSQKLNVDLLENTLMNWAHLLDAAAKNRAAKATLEAMGAAVDANGNALAIEADEDTARQMGNAMGKRGNVVWFMDGGRKRFFLVDDPYLLTAVSALEFAGFNSPAMKALGGLKHALTVGVTASPFFKVRNLIRDSLQAIGTAPLSANAAGNVAQGWRLTNPKSDEFFRLLAGGGTIHFGTMLEGSEAKRVQALVESGIGRHTILDTRERVMDFYRHYVEPGITAYNELGNRGEAVNRATLYAQLRRQGQSHAQASLQARDLMDFSMQGSWSTIRFLTQVVPFMNARLQGLYKLGRAHNENPLRFYATVGATALASLGLLFAFHDDDDWKKREDWDRNNFWWFKFGGMAFRIPKPFEIGAIATLAERGAEWAFDDEMTTKRFRDNVLSLLSDNLAMNPVPQLVKPMMDVYANIDSFTGRPIESMGMERLKSEYRFDQRTSMFARGASTLMNKVAGLVDKEALSPVQIDHLIRGYFGWLGTMIVTAGDVARYPTGQPDRPATDWWKTASGGMIANLQDAPSRYVSQMYVQAKEVERAYGTWQQLLREGKVDEAQAFRADNAQDLARYHRMEQVKRLESALNLQKKRIEAGPGSPEQKRDQLREIQERQDRLARPVSAR